MKIKMNTTTYVRFDGLTLKGPGIVDINPSDAEYLVNTFPGWFEYIDEKAETKEKGLRKRRKTK